MGIYDRDYERNRNYGGSSGFQIGSSLTWTTKLVLTMAAIYVVQLLTRPTLQGQFADPGWFTDLFSLHADVPARPWRAFELITYGFLHDPFDFKHILFNCFALWMFGRSVEYRYGAKEYLTFFCVSVVFAGLSWVAGEFVANRALTPVPMLGASGGIAAVLLLFCLNFPHQQIYIWGVLPMPAWVFALMFIGIDVFGAVHQQGSGVAFTAHLGGALFAFLYYRYKLRLSDWLPASWKMPKFRRRPPLRVLDPHDDQTDRDDSAEAEVDEILRKIGEHGQDSLTRRERRILQQASEKYQKRGR
jgi:rhomboid family protein